MYATFSTNRTQFKKLPPVLFDTSTFLSCLRSLLTKVVSIALYVLTQNSGDGGHLSSLPAQWVWRRSVNLTVPPSVHTLSILHGGCDTVVSLSVCIILTFV